MDRKKMKERFEQMFRQKKVGEKYLKNVDKIVDWYLEHKREMTEREFEQLIK